MTLYYFIFILRVRCECVFVLFLFWYMSVVAWIDFIWSICKVRFDLGSVRVFNLYLIFVLHEAGSNSRCIYYNCIAIIYFLII